MKINSEPSLSQMFCNVPLRAARVTRLDDRYLGCFNLDAETARSCGEENIGLFIGGCTSIANIVMRFRSLDQSVSAGTWIVVIATRTLAAVVYKEWLDSEDVWYVDPADVPESWEGNRVRFCTVEALPKLQLDSTVAGIFVLDPQCIIHHGRGFDSGSFSVQHDRPQIIVDFRFNHSVGDWAPPLIFISKKPAKSVRTLDMQRTYCLEAFHYLDGTAWRCGRIFQMEMETDTSLAVA